MADEATMRHRAAANTLRDTLGAAKRRERNKKVAEILASRTKFNQEAVDWLETDRERLVDNELFNSSRIIPVGVYIATGKDKDVDFQFGEGINE